MHNSKCSVSISLVTKNIQPMPFLNIAKYDQLAKMRYPPCFFFTSESSLLIMLECGWRDDVGLKDVFWTFLMTTFFFIVRIHLSQHLGRSHVLPQTIQAHTRYIRIRWVLLHDVKGRESSVFGCKETVQSSIFDFYSRLKAGIVI